MLLCIKKAIASSSAAVGRQQSKGGNRNKNNNNNNGNRSGLSDNERKRRSVMKGKCHRCGSPDHMANMAKTSSARGAMVSATLKQLALLWDRPPPNNQSNPSLALEYQPESAQANCAMAFAGSGGHHSFPTPPALL